jgi:hypothetical protein
MVCWELPERARDEVGERLLLGHVRLVAWQDALCVDKLVLLHDELSAAVEVGEVDELAGVLFVVRVAAVHHHNHLQRRVPSARQFVAVLHSEILQVVVCRHVDHDRPRFRRARGVAARLRAIASRLERRRRSHAIGRR